jgi:hypothetical protein
MKHLRLFLLIVLCVALTSAMGYAKDVGQSKTPPERTSRYLYVNPDLGTDVQAPRAPMQASTTFLGSWGFDSGPNCVDQSWVTIDLTEQLGEFWHVDDFAGLSGGSWGVLYPLEGAQSMWCGARPDAGSMVLCGYAVLPGYGNGWTQIFCSDCFTVSGNVNLSFLVAWDSEPGWDQSFIEYSLCDDTWIPISSAVNSGNGGLYDGTSLAVVDSVVIASGDHSGSVQIRFKFAADGAWSDEDGLWNTDGAIIVDSLVVNDGTGQLSYEDFESATVGDKGAGAWNSCNEPGYGDYAVLYPGLQLQQRDPCRSDLDCMWTFFTGSTYDYSCAGYPGVTTIPYGNTRGQYLFNEVWSPQLAWTGTGSQAELRFWVYRDLPDDALIFYIYHVRSFVAGCPQTWQDDGFVYGGFPNPDWLPEKFDIGDKVLPGATHIQIALGCWDMCPFVCGIWGTGECHGPAPYFDDVRVYRIAANGPQWRVRGIDLFQDNFSADGTTTGTVRTDMAQDILVLTNPNNVAGDSVVVEVSDPEAGVAGDSYTGFGPSVYAFVRIDPPQPAKSGGALTDDIFRFPVVDSVITADGNLWYMVRFDTAFTQPGRVGTVVDRFCIDLNDNLLVPGDQMRYFFGAKSADVAGSWTYYFNQYNHLDNTDAVNAVRFGLDIDEAAANAEEMTCLPDVGGEPGADILYVNDAAGRSARPYFDTAFQQLNLTNKVDRYDVIGPSSNVGNGLTSRVVDAYQQLLPLYKKIIWNSGNLNRGTIGDGVVANEKTDDYALLYTFVDQSILDPGLWIGGDLIGAEWVTLGTASPIQLRTAYMNFNLVDSDHGDLGLPISPLVIGATGGAFETIAGPDTMVAFGGCPGINQFDVLEPTGLSQAEAYYNGNTAYAAILSQTTVNAQGSTAKVLFSGYSFHNIRDDRPVPVMDRVIHMKRALEFLGNTPDEPTSVDPTFYRNSLSQNRPNPFNPTTTIEFTLKERANVQLKIYNVAGQLVRTLVNEARTPGEVHTATWDGRNDAGQSVSSGVYFYKLVAGNFVQTKKMVLLK